MEDCRQVVDPLLEELRDEIGPDLKWEFVPELGFEFDAVALELTRETGRLRVFVTFEAWVNAASNASDMRDRLRRVAKKVGTSKNIAYVITSTGVIEKGPRTSTQQLLDDAAAMEADVETERFRKSLKAPR
jgi:hypothetical protein